MFSIHIQIKKVCFFVFFICFFIVSYVYASVSVELTLDRASIGLSDTVVMKVNVSGAKRTSLPQFSGLDAFDVVRGPTSSKVQIINGKTLLGVDYTFYLNPLQYGDFKIGPASVAIDGKTYYSNKVHIVVDKSSEGEGGKQKDALFIEASVSKESLYVNQQAVYLVKFFRSGQVSDLSLDMPEISGITFESLGEPKEYSSIIDSRHYEVVELRYAISAKKEGEYRILPLKIRMTVYEKNRRNSFFQDPWQNSFFQDPFFSMDTGKPVCLASNEIIVKVKNLPAENRPSDFTGLVGQFAIDSVIEPESIKVNDSLTLTIQVSGSGNIRQIPDFKIKDIDNLKIYQDKPVLDIKKSAAGITGTKTMKWAIVPEKKGLFIIPDFFLSYFDPVKESYIKLKTGPIKIKALADPENKMNYLSAMPVEDSGSLDSGKKNMKKSIERIGKDIFPVHTSNDPLKSVHDHIYMKWLFVFFIVLPPIVFSVLFAVMTIKKSRAMRGNVLKSKNAFKICINKLGRENLTSKNIYDSIVEYLNDRFLLKGGVVTPDEAAKILLDKGASNEIAENLLKNMKRLEAEIFAGKGQKDFEYDIRDNFVNLVNSIEKGVK